MGTRMLQRRGTAAQWSLANPVLGAGELGIESDTGVVKSGDGVNNWRTLPAVLGSTYLPLLGKAADADKLDGLDSTAFLQKTEATATYLPLTTASSTYQSQSSIVSANTPLAPVRRDGVGNSSFNEVMLVGQTTAASAARKDYVDTTDTSRKSYIDGLVLPAGASRSLVNHYGTVTAFPTTPKVGDRCRRSDIGTGGSEWFYSSAGWRCDDVVASTVTVRDAIPSAARYTGMRVWVTSQNQYHEWDGTAWDGTVPLLYFFPSFNTFTNTTVSGFQDIAAGRVPYPGWQYTIEVYWRQELYNVQYRNMLRAVDTVSSAELCVMYTPQPANSFLMMEMNAMTLTYNDSRVIRLQTGSATGGNTWSATSWYQGAYLRIHPYRMAGVTMAAS